MKLYLDHEYVLQMKLKDLFKTVLLFGPENDATSLALTGVATDGKVLTRDGKPKLQWKQNRVNYRERSQSGRRGGAPPGTGFYHTDDEINYSTSGGRDFSFQPSTGDVRPGTRVRLIEGKFQGLVGTVTDVELEVSLLFVFIIGSCL